MNKQEIFNLITETRKEKGITQLKLANMVDINEKNLIGNLKGYSKMSLDTLIDLCDVLQLKINITK